MESDDKTLTLALCRAGAVAALADMGEDFVYATPTMLEDKTSCLYIPNTDTRAVRWRDKPQGRAETGCLVGRIIEHAGMMTDKVAMAMDTIANIITYGVIKATPEASRYLQAIQSAQDTGSPWGSAVELGEQALVEEDRWNVH